MGTMPRLELHGDPRVKKGASQGYLKKPGSQSPNFKADPTNMGKSWCREGLHNAVGSGVPLLLWFPEVGRGGGGGAIRQQL